MFCLFILLIQQIIVNGTVTHSIVPADIRSRNGIDQTAVDRTYQITGSGIFGIISPVLRNRRRIVTGSVTTLGISGLIISGLSVSGLIVSRLIVSGALVISVLGSLGILIRNLDLFVFSLAIEEKEKSFIT